MASGFRPPKKPGATRRYRVADGYQIHHDGVVYTAGDEVAAPEGVATTWVIRGWAVELDPPKKPDVPA